MAVNQTEQTEHSSTEQRVEAVALFIGAAACLISTAASIHYGRLALAALCALVAVCLLYYLIDKHSDGINERIVAFSLAFSLVALSILLPLWGVVNIVWAGQDARREIEETGEFTAGSSWWTATLEYPRVALQGEEGRPLELRIIPANLSAVPASIMTPVPTTTTITATSGITATTTITAMMPATATTPLALTAVISPVEGQGLRVVNDSGAQVAGASVPLPADGTSGHLRLLLHNDGTLSGWRETRTLTVSLHDPASANAPIETLTATILVEGDRAFTLRRFVNSTIDEASPLIYVALLLLPVTAVLVQRLIDERKRRRLEQITRLWDEFREYFLAGEIGEPALGILGRLEPLKHREPIIEQYLDTGLNFIDFANGFGYLPDNSDQPTNTPADAPENPIELKPEVKRVLEMYRRWPEGYAAAYLILYKKFREKYYQLDIISWGFVRTALSKARLRLQYLALADHPDLRDRLAAAFVINPDATPIIQSRRWPPAQPERTNAPRYLPFTGDDAAESGEAAFLAGNSNRGFYGRHPLFNRTLRVLGSRDAGTHLVYGAAGSGRTAFARTCANTERANEIAVLIRGLPDPVDMRLRIGRRLTEFVLTHPTHLEKIGGGRMSALASVLIDAYGYLTAISKVEHVQANLEGLHDLVNEDQREVAGQFLQLLARALTDEEARRDRATTKLVPVGRHDGSGGYLPECLRAFDFQLITFVIDLPDSDAAAAWLSDELPSLMEGQHSGLTRYLVFTPRAVPRVFLYYPNNHTLDWTKSQLREMANTRYAHVYGRQGLAAQQFDPSSGLDTLIEHSKAESGEEDYNPRQFLRLWRVAARGLQKEEIIDATRVAQAIREVKGSKS